jgi:hypothetical protein
MIRFSPRKLATLMAAKGDDGSLERAWRELEELREKVQKAELAAWMSGERLPSPSRHRGYH